MDVTAMLAAFGFSPKPNEASEDFSEAIKKLRKAVDAKSYPTKKKEKQSQAEKAETQKSKDSRRSPCTNHAFEQEGGAAD